MKQPWIAKIVLSKLTSLETEATKPCAASVAKTQTRPGLRPKLQLPPLLRSTDTKLGVGVGVRLA